MPDTINVIKEATSAHSLFWPPFWGAFLGILAAMITYFLKETIKKIETSYGAVCELEMYLGDLVKYVGLEKGLIGDIRSGIKGVQQSNLLSIQFKAGENPVSPDDIKYLSQSDLKNEWVTIKFRMGVFHTDMVSVIEAMKSKAEFYNANQEKLIQAGIPISSLFQKELDHLQYLEGYLDERYGEIVRLMARVRKHLQRKGIWISLKTLINFQSRYRPTEQEIDIEEKGVRAEIKNSIILSKIEIDKLKGKEE
ncbi:MAG: hypothetical protein ACUZ8I_05140 [Candidatus Scalindua sp.]